MRFLLLQLPANIRRYFAVQLSTIPLLYLTQHLKTYPYIYLAVTGLVLLTIFHITWEVLGEGKRAAVFIGLIAMMLCRTAYLGAGRVFTHSDWIVLAEAFPLTWAGIIAAFLAPHLRHSGTMFTLGLTWIGLALYDWGFILHWPHWLGVNGWLPTVIVLASYAVIVLLQHPERRHGY